MIISPEIAIRIIFDVIGIVVTFYGVVHILFYKLSLPGFEGRWAMNLALILIPVGVVLLALGNIVL